MTEADTIYDTINDNWGSGGYGGAAPAITTTETPQQMTNLTAADVIEVRHKTLRERPKPVNDKYTNRYYFIDIFISSKTSNAQLKLIYDEVEYLLRNTTMTGIQLVNITKDWNVSPPKLAKTAVLLEVEFVALMSDGAVTSAAGATASMQALLMYGAANAAWVPCSYEGCYFASYAEIAGAGQVLNTGATDMTLFFLLPLPTVKGSLKLYISGTKFGLEDADADDYVNNVKIWGITDSATILDTDATNYDSAGVKTDTFTAVDCSSYDHIKIEVECVNTNASDLDVHNIKLRCYYA